VTVSMIETTINERWKLLLPEHRAARPEWPVWEKERLASMHEHLTALVRSVTDWSQIDPYSKRPVIIDVGAEEGDFPALWAQWGMDVILFEPNPKVWPNIKAIWDANFLPHPLAMFVGFASDQTNVSPPNDTVHSKGYLAEDGWPNCAHGEVIGNHGFRHLAEQAGETPQIEIDVFCAERTIHAITMDVEGSELRVLKGARRILERDRPLVWVSCHTDYEWNDTRYEGVRSVDVVEWMQGVVYVGEHLINDHEDHWFFRPSESL